MQFDGKVAVVTGAGSGIGRASAQAFAAKGARVVVADISLQGGAETVEVIRREGGEATFVHVDTSSYESVHALVRKSVELYQSLDIMYNNAGIGNAQVSVLEMPIEEYHRTVSVNQHGVFYGIKAAGTVMKDQGRGGVIINTASVYGFIADRRQFPYHASKGAVVMMTKAAALELARYSIRVVAVAPGLIDTHIVDGWRDTPLWDGLKKAHMRKEIGKPEEVANVVTFLASDEASLVNGQVYMVDDGLTSFKA